MNFAIFYLSRVFAIAVVTALVLALLGVGASINERRLRPEYVRLGAQIAEKGTARVRWVLWPPQAYLLGTYKGSEFRYWRTHRVRSHLTLNCLPREAFAVSRRERSYRAPLWPGWTALHAFTTRVPLSRRSADRRPLGFGSAPGIDLHRETNNPFDAPAVLLDLERLKTYCSAT